MVQNARQLPASSTDTGGALSQQVTYDRNGNVTGVTDALDSARSKTMSYDALDRLTSATSTSFGGSGTHAFAYDPLDNLRSWTLGGVKDLADYVYSAQNRLTEVRNSAGSVVHQFSYDPQGNITSRNTVPHDFDYGNRLRAVPGIEAYRYDGSGRRVQSTKANGSTTLWMYSQSGQMLFSSKLPAGGGQTTHENVYLAGSLVATIDHNWPSNAIIATKYQHTDALGSPVAITNEAGAVIERTNFDPYGGAIGKVLDGLGYTGHVMDPLTGLTYMQQRYYDQGAGRFLSVDPVTASSVNGGNFNRYWYGNNNTYRFTDPDGRFGTSRHKGYCEMVGVCQQPIKPRRSGSDIGESRPVTAEAAKRYKRLRDRVTTEAADDPNATLQLSRRDIATITNHMVIQARDEPKHFIGSEDFTNQFIGFDTFIYKEGLASRQFNVAGRGLMSGGDINYIGVGALYAAYGMDKSAVTAGVLVWNGWQYATGGGDHNRRQMSAAMPWAYHGYDQYSEVSEDY